MSVDQQTLQSLESALQARNLETLECFISNLKTNSVEQQYNLLLAAISSGYLQLAKLLINRNFNLSVDSDNKILHLAIRKGDFELVDLLIRSGLSTSLTDKDGMPPLFNLAHNSSNEIECSKILNCLLQSGTYINIKCRTRGFTLLHRSCELENALIVALLLKKKCHRNTKAKDGSTPLHIAARKGNSKIVSLLLKDGAKYNLLDSCQRSPLCSAASSGDLATFDIFLQRFQHSCSISNLRSGEKSKLLEQPDNHLLVYCATEGGNAAIIGSLFQHGLPADSYSPETGNSALYLAVEKQNEEIVDILLKNGAKLDVNKDSDKQHFTILHLACEKGSLPIVATLLETGKCSLDAKSTEGSTALHLAVRGGDSRIVSLLLKRGADRTILDKKNRTALSYATVNTQGNVMTKEILSRLDLATENGELPIVSEILQSRPDPTTLFEPRGENGSTLLHIAVENGYPDILELFLKTGIPANLSSKDGLKPLHIAVRKEDKNLIMLLLKFGADVDAPGQFEIETPLFLAATIGNSDIIEILAEASTKRSSNWIEGYPMLCIAAYQGHKEVVSVLLNKGVDPNTNHEEYLTPLHAAAQKGHTNIVQLLVERGAKINLVRKPECMGSKFISTPLLAAAHSGHTEIVHFLLEHGADFNAKITSRDTREIIMSQTGRILIQGDYKDFEIARDGFLEGYTCLHFAVEAGNESVFEKLIQLRASVNFGTKRGLRPLGFAIERGDQAMVQKLLFSGINITLKHRKESILKIKSLEKYPKIAEMILEYASSSNSSISQNITPLGLAVENQLEKIVENLLKAGADPNIEYKSETVLHTAIKTKNSAIVRLLLKQGADTNICTETHGSGLSIAVENDDFTIVQDLLEAGADTKLQYRSKKMSYSHSDKNHFKYKPLNLAVIKKNAKIVELFLKKESLNSYPEKESPFLIAIQNSNLEVVEKLISYGASVHSKDEKGRSLIFLAVSGNDVKVLELFLRKGISPNEKSTEGESLLDHVLRSNHGERKKILQLLVHYGAAVNVKNKEGFSPLNLSLNESGRSLLFEMKLFLENGADPNYVEKLRGELIIDLAIKKENPEIVELLLLHGADVNLLNNERKTPLQVSIKRAEERTEQVIDKMPIRFRGNNCDLDNLKYDRYLNFGDFRGERDIRPYRKIVRLVVREVARRKAAGEGIREENKTSINSQFVKSYYERCEREIQLMKKWEICVGLSFFDILIAKNCKLAAYARNQKVLKALTAEHVAKFHEYKQVLIDRFEIGKKRRILLEASYAPLKKVLRFSLPALIAEEIFSYLTDRDLRNLINVFENMFSQ